MKKTKKLNMHPRGKKSSESSETMFLGDYAWKVSKLGVVGMQRRTADAPPARELGVRVSLLSDLGPRVAVRTRECMWEQALF